MLALSVLIMISTNSCMSGRTDNNDSKVYEAAILYDAQTQEMAFRQYSKLVKYGDRRALPLLASCYMYGTGVEKDEAEARMLFLSFSGESISVPFQITPVELRIEITGNEMVKADGRFFIKEDERLDELVKQINGLQLLAREHSCPFYVHIVPHPDTSHLRILNVIDACIRAGVESPYFYDQGMPDRPKMIF